MELLDSRRYTGPNLVWNRAGAVLDIDCSDAEAEPLIVHWQAHAQRLLDALGWADEHAEVHRFSRGVSLALSAPLDALYSAVEIAECAWRAACAKFGGDQAETFSDSVERLRELIDEESRPELLALQSAARTRNVAFLSDDDEVSVGLGRGSQTWPVTALPDPDAVTWPELGNVPVGLVTGTNGKTTSVRLASRILRAAGLNVGLSSTDWVGVNDEIIDRGDYSGPGGARAALRHPKVDVAVLETARGGLLRRGLGVAHADAALITNIAEDHLGDFGSRNLRELLDVKWIVTRALDDQSLAVLNADDPLLVARAAELEVPVLWFAMEPSNATLAAHTRGKGQAMSIVAGDVAHFDGARWQPICRLNDIPLTMNGAARHNVANALGAAGLTHALGASYAAISEGLRRMTNDDNPGRCNFFDIDGVEVLVDFAHNPQGIAALFELAVSRPARRRALVFGQAGDRTDQLIREQTRIAWQTGLDRVVVSELARYHRGRERGEVFALIRDELLACGARPDQIAHYEEEPESLNDALAWAKPGDLVIMLALADAPLIMDKLSRMTS